ncbi:MAG: VCBS repeat-containing protein, partial [Planctomycetota bacterium]
MTSARARVRVGTAAIASGSAAAIACGLLAGCGENPTLRPGPPPEARTAPGAAGAAGAAGDAAANAPKASAGQPRATPARKGPWPLSFLARRELALPGKPACLWAGDLDGDGRDELAVALQSPGRLLVWRGTATGIAREPLS